MKLTRGYYGARKNVWTVAKNTWERLDRSEKYMGERFDVCIP